MTQPSVLDALVTEIESRIGRKHDAPGLAGATVGYAHGPGGILSFPGVDPVVFHTIMGAQTMLGQLPASPSLYMNPTFQTLTGVTDESGTEPDGVCDPGPEAGLLKSCILTAPFGRYKRQTQEIELDRIGQRVDRADPMDLTLVGSPIADAGVFSGPGGVDPAPANLLDQEVQKRFWERNVAIFRLLSRQLWIANPANNAAFPNGGYREFAGFETLITTGHMDAQNGQVCPAVDSYVRDFNNQRIDVAPGPANIVAALTDIYYQLKDRATRTGVMPVRWVIAMRPQLFYELAAVWPCSYLSFRCDLPQNAELTVDGQDQVRFRDEMRAGKYLLIDGERVPVIVDDGISEDTDAENANVPAGCFGTDIFFIPMSVVGGRAVTFLEYFQYANPAVQDALGNMILGRIEGAFVTWPVQTRGCFQWESKIEPRIILRTPWLAGRLENVNYCPAQHTRDAFPDEAYFVDGGRTSRPGPSYYNVWNA